MAQALELFFDPATESAVRTIWANLEARGLRSLMRSRQGRHRPHVTLAVAERMTLAQADTATTPLRDANDLALRLGSVAVFPGRQGVLYLAVVPTLRLLRLHREVHARLMGAGVETDRHYLPDVWVPHCTLAEGLTQEQVTTAVGAVKRLRPIPGEAFGVGLVDTDTGAVTPIAELPHSVGAD
ncbi:MAG TPA: 2'-5' RNA ligase family protein [Euzebyales bacterium]|nr:2'-5' RNA ligase family protein [Euzebyales bacterium]